MHTAAESHKCTLV